MKTFLKFQVATFLFALVIGLAALVLSQTSWRLIGNVPETPVQVFDHYPQIYVKTIESRSYLCDSQYKGCALTDAVLDRVPPSPRVCDTPDLPQPFPDGRVTASFALRLCAPDASYDRYVLGLEDGTIWFASEVPFIGLLPFVIGGLVILVSEVFGLFYLILDSLFRPHPRSKEKNDFKRL